MSGPPCPKRGRAKHEKRPLTLEEREFLARVRALPCVACLRAQRIQTSPTEAHHIKRDPFTGQSFGMGYPKADPKWAIPLCRDTHHWNGVNVHISQAQFEKENGNELELLALTYAMLGEPYPFPYPEAA